MTGVDSERPARELAGLLGMEPGALPSGDGLEVHVEARLAALGLARPAPTPAEESEAEDPRWLGWWLLRMAVATYRQLRHPPPAPDPGLLARFEELAADRPDRRERHGQLHVDPASTLRRAQAIRARLASAPGPVLAVGDDDLVTVALAVLGVPDLHAVDVDPRILRFLSEAARRVGVPIGTHRRDVFAEPLPCELRHRCAVTVADPLRSAEGALPFLAMGAAALRPEGDGRLMWADHPDWTFDHGTVREALEARGFVLEATLERLHAYPLSRGLFPALDEVARVTGTDAGWWGEVVDRSRAFTHLYVFRR